MNLWLVEGKGGQHISKGIFLDVKQFQDRLNFGQFIMQRAIGEFIIDLVWVCLTTKTLLLSDYLDAAEMEPP